MPYQTAGSMQRAVGSKQEKPQQDKGAPTTGQQDQEAKRKEQSDDRPQTTGQQTTDSGQQIADQQSVISGQPSAKQNTERQEAVGSEQSAGLQDQEAKSEKQQKDYEPDITGPLSPVRTDLGTPLAADRIW